MLLSDYERKELRRYATMAHGEFVYRDEGRSSNDPPQYKLKAEQSRQLVDLFSQEPCNATHSQIKRCFTLSGMIPGGCFSNCDLAEWDEFYDHMNCRIREDKELQKLKPNTGAQSESVAV